MNRKQGEVREVSAQYRAELAEAADVPRGYKRTEVGVIPADWKVGELQRYHPFITSGSRGWARYYSEDGDLFIRITNLSRSSIYLDLSSNRYVRLPCGINSEGLRTQLENGDLLISITADIGIVGYIDKSVPKPAYINQHISLVRFTVNDVDTLYLAYFLASEQSQRKFKASTDQGAKAGLNLEGVGKIVAAFPAMEEQRAIATAMSDVDALIAALDKLIAKKRAIKTAAMQQLLAGKQRLPGFTGEWEVKRLGDLAEIIMGQSPSSQFYNKQKNGLPLIQGNADIVNRKTIKRIYTTQITKQCLSGDILMSVRAPVGEISRSEFDACLGRGVCAIRYKNDFLYHYLIWKEPSWAKLSKGSTFESVNSDDIKAMEITLPHEIGEQTAIAQILSDMDAEITALEKRRTKTRAIKQGMMQELLTGRTRLV